MPGKVEPKVVEEIKGAIKRLQKSSLAKREFTNAYFTLVNYCAANEYMVS